MNSRILLFVIVSLFAITFVSAVNECNNDNSFLGTFPQGRNVNLVQTCDTCTYVNLSKVVYPNGTVVSYNTVMTKIGVEYNQTTGDSKILGCYSYCVYGDKDGTIASECIDYRITPSGQGGGSSNIVFFIFIIAALYIITAVGWFNEIEWLTILGGMAMIGLGIYMIRFGIIIYRDWITNYFSYITIGIGLFASVAAAIHWMNN